jgi:hypothetical protein
LPKIIFAFTHSSISIFIYFLNVKINPNLNSKMKPLLLFIGILCFMGQEALSQPVEIQRSVIDTLPSITIKKNWPILVGSIVLLGASSYLIINANTYVVGKHKYYGTAPLSRYLLATDDSLLVDFYQKHRRNRVFWLMSGTTGTVMFTVTAYIGLVYLFSSIFGFNDPTLEKQLTAGLIGSAVLIGSSIHTRVVSFRQLRQAVGIYNQKYAAKPPVSLGICPTSSGIGVGLALRF